ncbi:MAG: ABC transporter ATP-binding protein [Elusimicrobiota bacterium]
MKSIKIVRRLKRFIKPYNKRFFIALFAMVIVGATTSAHISLIKPVMDGIFSAQGDLTVPIINFEIPKKNAIFNLSFIIIAIAVIKGIFFYIQSYYMAYIGQNVTKDLRNRLFRHLMYLSLGYYIVNPTGQLLSRMTNDVKFLEQSVVKVPTRFIRDGFSLIFLVILLFYFNWKWAFISIFGFLFIIIPFAKFAKMLRNIGRTGHQKMADIYDFLAERISGIRLIKAFSTEKQELRRMGSVNKKFLDVVLKSERISSFQSPFTEFLSTLGIVAIIVIGGLAVLKGNTTPGTFFGFMGTLVAIYMPAKNLAKINQQLQRALAASERIFDVLDYSDHILQAENPKELTGFKNEIRYENLSFAYQDEDYVLKDINLQIKRGDIAAFVGASGAGKTTLVNLVPRFFDPQKGRILLDGVDLKEYSIKSLRQKIAMVMQDVILFNASIKENICYGLGDFSDQEVMKYAKIAHAHEFIKHFPDGYDTIVGEKGVRLSGGQKQRISIARALIKDPEILILDEATSHLDTQSEKLVQDALDKLMKGRTTLVIAHRLSTVRKADHIIVLKNGKIEEQGRHEELLSIPGIYRKMFEMQSL